MTKKDEDILLTDSMRAAGISSVAPDPDAAERNARREYQKRMKQYKKKKRRKIFGLILESVLLLIVCVGLWGINTFVKAYDKMAETTKASNVNVLPSLDPSSTPGQPSFIVEDADGSTEVVHYTVPETQESVEEVTVPAKTGFSTFAVFGVDARNTDTMEQWTQGDVVILVSLNNATKEVRLCSVYRDFAFESETDGGLGKITDSYCRYGVQHTVEAMNRNFDLQIDDYVVVNWTAVADVIDALDGIDMHLSAAEAEAMGWYVYETQVATKRPYTVKGLPIQEGTYHLNGGQALSVARIRKGVGDDYARTARQRTIISLMLQKAKTMKLSQLSAIITAITDNVRFSFDKLEILDLVSHAFDYNISDSAGFPFNHVTFPFSTSMVYADTLESNVTKLHSFLYGDENYVPSGNVRRIGSYQSQEIAYYRSKTN